MYAFIWARYNGAYESATVVLKFSDSWEGPYEVLQKVTPMTFEIAVPWWDQK